MTLRRAAAVALAATFVCAACGIDTEGDAEWGDPATGPEGPAGGAGGQGGVTGWPDAAAGGSAGAAAADGAAGAGGVSDGAAGDATADVAPPGDTGSDNPGGETDCLDGKDDDGDKLVDCADPDCQAGFECVDAVPGGWTGYAYLFGAAFDPKAPLHACPAGAAVRFYENPNDSPACSACACGGAQGGKCDAAEVSCKNDHGQCDGSAGLPPWPSSPGCYAFPPVPGVTISCQMKSPTLASAGTCSASGGKVQSPPWGSQNDACALAQAGKGCKGGQACVPKRAGAYAGSSLCLQHDLPDGKCPPGTAPAIGWSGYTDGRTCAQCQCAAPAGGSCAQAPYVVYGCVKDCTKVDTGCANPSFCSLDQCCDLSMLVGPVPWSVKTTAPGWQPGTCKPSGGQAQGNLAKTGGATFCCLP